MPYPHYHYPPLALLSITGSVLFGGRRSFKQDALDCLALLDPPARWMGVEHLPLSGPCLITFNHYYRPGFSAWWMALALSAANPVDMHFVMTSELTFPGKWYAGFGRTGSRWLLKRFAKIYGFTRMPSMPPRPGDVNARANAVRSALAFARSHPQAFIGLAPEGGDQTGGVLNWPPTGSGRFMLLLAEMGFPIIPAGVFEENGTLRLHFGELYRLRIPIEPSVEGRDRVAAGIVMRAIARQLPERLRGEFGEAR